MYGISINIIIYLFIGKDKVAHRLSRIHSITKSYSTLTDVGSFLPVTSRLLDLPSPVHKQLPCQVVAASKQIKLSHHEDVICVQGSVCRYGEQ